MKFARSSYYKALILVPSKHYIESESLKSDIKQTGIDSKCRYEGSKIQKTLLDQGKKISLKRVQRFMSVMDIRLIAVKKFRYT